MERAYNPQTGEYLFLVNGQWVPPAQEAVNPKTNERAFLVGNQWQVVPQGDPFEPRPEDQSAFRSALDIPLKLAGGVTQGVRMVADTFGAGSETSKAIKGVEDWIGQFYSAQSKQDAKEISRLMEEAKDKGALDQIKLGLKAFATAPVDLVVSALGTSAPAILAGVGATLGGAPVAATVALTTGLGAVMGAGGIKGAIYEATKEELVKAGLPEAEAEKRAELAQQYKGENLDSILLGAGIGAVAGRTGVESAIAKQMASRILGKAAATEAAQEVPEQVARQQAQEAVAQAAARGPVKQAAIVGGKEFGTEFGQAVQEKTAENIALQREGFDVPTFQGAIAAGTLEGLAGAGLGGAFGAREASVARQEKAKLDQLNQIKGVLDQTPNEQLPPDEQIAELRQRYGAQMPQAVADELARSVVETRAAQLAEAQKTGAPIPDFIKPDPEYVAYLENQYVADGVPPVTARAAAIADATEDAYNDYLYEQEQKQAEVKDVTEPITPAGREGVPVAAQPDVEPPTPGAEVTKPVGVVSPTEDVGVPTGREAAQPSAVEKEGAPGATETVEAVKAKEEGPAAPAEGATVEGAAPAPVAKTTAEPAAPVEPVQLADTLANAAFTTRGQVTGAEDKFQQLDDSIQQRRQELEDTLAGVSAAPDVQKTALARFDAAVENLKRGEEFDPIGFARAQAQASFDQRNSTDYSSPQEAIDFGRDNVNDTLTEYGATSRYTQDRANRAYDEEIARLQAAAPAPAAPAKKRGPKGPRLTEEQRTAKAKARKPELAEYNRNRRAQIRAEKALAQADKTEDAAEKRTLRAEALHTLFEIDRAGVPKPQRTRAKEAIAKSGATPEEMKRIADTHKAWKDQREADRKADDELGADTLGNVDPLDEDYGNYSTGVQAAAHIMRTGSEFQRLVAMRIRGVLKNVKFVVIERGDSLPPELQQSSLWPRARGLYFPDQKVIYVKGGSFGAMQGSNAVTVLHELLHAATSQKIAAGTSAAVEELRALANLAKKFYEVQERRGLLPPELIRRVDGTMRVSGKTGYTYEIFDSLDEFLAYGMSDDAFQRFLASIPGYGFDQRASRPGPLRSAIDRLVQIVRDIFTIPTKYTPALTDLITITDKLVAARPTGEELAQGPLAQSVPKLKAKAKASSKKVNSTLDKVTRSHVDSPTFRDGIEQLVKDRDPALFNDFLAASFKAFKSGTLRQLLPTLQTETLVEWARRLGVSNIPKAWNLINDMNALRVTLTAKASPISEALVKLQRKDIKMYEALATVMHYSTLRGVDPSTQRGYARNPALAALWDKLSPEAQTLYKDVRDYYQNNYDLYYQTLTEQVERYKLPAEARGKLIAEIKQLYEEGRKNTPYFPLMRYGRFWVRVGKGRSGKFYMFESQTAKEVFIKQWFRAEQAANPSAKLDELYASGDVEDGNNINDARKTLTEYSTLLKEIFNIIDTSAEKPTAVDKAIDPLAEYTSLNPEVLKDKIYQLVLHTLPEKNFRRKFIHRQGKEGFSKDIARNFATMSTDTANQLARLKYAPLIMSTVEAANDELAGNPDKAKLAEFVDEMRLRAQQYAYPAPEDAFTERAANFATTTAFLWYMTNVKTAIAQVSALPVFVGPVLGSEYGVLKTAQTFARFLPVWNSFGVRTEDKDGNVTWTTPTIAESKAVKLNEEERRAARYMVDRGISETTLAYDLGNRRLRPTAVQNSVPRMAIRTTVGAMSALFHHVEKLNREMTFLAAFRMARDRNPKASFEDVALEAEKITYEALGNFSAVNRPRGVLNTERGIALNAHKPLGRAVLQFKMFPAFVTTYFVRNMYRMLGPEYSKAERKQAAMQLFGTLTTSLTLAGVMGVPGISFALGVLSALRRLTLDDEDDEFIKRDLELYFRNIWLYETFGDVKVGGKSVAELLDRGAVAALTGADITSSLSLNNMWFPEVKESATAQAEALEYFVSILGPSASLILTQIPRAKDLYNKGKIDQAIEQLLPAMIRSPFTAYRYSEKGATTAAGAPIKEADEFTTGQLIGQALGFAPTGLVAQREALFKVNAQIMKVKAEKKQLMDRLDTEVQESDADLDKIFEKIDSFNARNWFDPIKADTIATSLRNRLKRRIADRGFQFDKKYYGIARELLDVPIDILEREATEK